MPGGMTDKQESRTEERSNTAMRIDPTWQRRGDAAYERALHAAHLGFQPNRGVRVAALTPLENAAIYGQIGAANAFGMPTVSSPFAGMATAVDNGTGVMGYGTGGAYDDMVGSLPAGYRAAIDSLFIDPETGAGPLNPFDGGLKRETVPQDGGASGTSMQGIFKPSSELGLAFDLMKRGLSSGFGFGDPGANVMYGPGGSIVQKTDMTAGTGFDPFKFGG